VSYQVLARKWRPRVFDDLVGQEHVVQALVNGLDQDRVHHAFLLTGTRGVGKTTIARILAKCLNCEQGVSSTPCGECSSCVDLDEGRFVDMLEIDAASKTKVDDTRELLETVQYTPTRGRFKVYIIDEVHMLSGHSFNALLKTLEEPPPHVKFVLATTDPQKLPVTILSRCLRFNLSRLLPEQIGGQLEKILEAEAIEAEDSAVMRIARAADGSMRDGLSLLDQAIAYGGGSLKDNEVASMLGSIDHVHTAGIINALAESDADSLLETVHDLVRQSRRLETVLDELAEAMHRIALIHAAPDFRDPERADWDSLVELAGRIAPEDAQLYYQVAVTGRRDLEMAPDPRTGLEMTLLRMLAFKPEDGASPTPPAGPAKDKTGDNKDAARKAREALEEMQRGDPTGQLELSKQPVSKPAAVEPAVVDSPPDWFSLQNSLELSGAARELARNLQLESAGQVRWKFLVPDTLQHLGTPSVVEDLQSALSARLGQPVMLELHSASEPVESVAAVAQRKVDDRMQEAEWAIEDDPTVREMKERFGARTVPDSVQPLQ
jgi:DNA polymerase-3 subunit gamma/tau